VALSKCRIRVLVVAGPPSNAVARHPQPDDPAAKLAAAVEDWTAAPAVDQLRPVDGKRGTNTDAGNRERR
jgi:hypothetical protein